MNPETRVSLDVCREVQASMMVEADAARPSWGHGLGLGFAVGVALTLTVQLALVLLMTRHRTKNNALLSVRWGGR